MWCLWENINVGMVLVGKPARKRQFGRPTLRVKDNIKMYLKQMGWENVDWFSLPRTVTWSGRF
jgi:hypothetical protein